MSPILSLYGLSYQVGGSFILKDISVEFQSGKITAVIGPNGSGKTTLLKLVAGVIDFQKGSGVVRYMGQDFVSLLPAEKAERVVYLGSDISTEFPLTVKEFVGLGSVFTGKNLTKQHEQRLEEALIATDLLEFADQSVGSLSGGERQRVNLARALFQDPKVFLLDESFSKMDVDRLGMVTKLLQKLAQLGKTIVFVSHDLNFSAELADEGLLIKNGKMVCCGSLEEVFTQTRLMELYPDSSMKVAPNPFTKKPHLFY